MGRRLGRTGVGLLAALAAGISGYLIAPDDWAVGPGVVSLELEGMETIAAEVTVGSDERIEFTSQEAARTVTLVFPNGVPVDGALEAWVLAREGDEVVLVDPADLELRIGLPDGRTELVPAVRWDSAEGRTVASRRPTRDADTVLGLLGVVVVLWVTEAVPLHVTSLLIPVVLVVTGTTSAAAATAPFANPIIVLFFAGFLMAEAMKRCELDRRVSLMVTAKAGRSPRVLFGTMLTLSAFLSMWMSNTAAAAVLIPIALAITAPIEHPGFRRALVLGIAYSATIGGVGSAIGTPANQLAIELLDGFAGRSIAFVEWFAFGLPMVVLFLPLMGAYLWLTSDIQLDPERLTEARRIATTEHLALGPITSDQRVLLLVFGGVMAGWLTETYHGVHAGIVALAGAVALFLVRRLGAEDLRAISWPALLTFGGGLTLGLVLVDTGTSDFVAGRLSGLAGVPPLVAVSALAMITLLTTTVASNTASAAILIPVAIPLAAVLGLDPALAVVVVAIASSVDFALVIGTPPTMIAYSTRLFTAGSIFRKGAVLDLGAIAVLVLIVIQVWEILGLV